jgi:hypothetical protein
MKRVRDVERFLPGALLGAMLLGAVFVNGNGGCTPAQRSTARTVLDVVQIACILANAESDDETVLRTCRIASEVLPDLKEILAAQRRAAEQYAAHRKAACARSDAGVEAPGK